MIKRLFAAVSMLIFACLATIVASLFDMAPDQDAFVLMVLPAALAAAVVGWFIQSRVIGTGSNWLRSTLVGALNAFLALPIAGSIIYVLEGLGFVGGNIFDDFGLSVLAVTLAGFLFLWWVIMPIGAIAGLSTHLIWSWIERGDGDI